MSTKYLNGENILRQVYDADAESLRTTAVATFSSGTISISISHLTDSIKIGDGTDFLAINPDGSINAVVSGTMNVEIDAADGDNIAISDGTDTLDVNADGSINVVISPVTNPVIENFVTTLANTEYSYAFPVGTKRFSIRARGSAKLQLAYVSGQSNIEYITIFAGAKHEEDNIGSVSITSYFRSNKAGETVEILSWS